ncbi:MAG: hypothetical protein IT521_08215 [Burkholderiales bacterium]|nr:hypothetical protein [Burkholderiales bacterium]
MRITKLRVMTLLLLMPLAAGVSAPFAQTKKAAPPVKAAAVKPPSAKDPSIGVHVFMRDASKNEILVGTRIWPEHPEYNMIALQRFFALMKMLGPTFRQDDDVGYTWATKGKVAKCSIYLESAEANAKSGTGATVGCEANGVSTLSVTSDDAGHVVSLSQESGHLDDVMALFKKQLERAKSNAHK